MLTKYLLVPIHCTSGYEYMLVRHAATPAWAIATTRFRAMDPRRLWLAVRASKRLPGWQLPGGFLVLILLASAASGSHKPRA